MRAIFVLMAMWALSSSTACGRLGFDVTGGRDAGRDGGRDGGATVLDGGQLDAPMSTDGGPSTDGDIALDGARATDDGGCELSDWGEAVALTTLNTSATEWGPYMAPDRLEVLFGSDRPGGEGAMDIYRATRTTSEVPFDTPVLVRELVTPFVDDNPYLTDDGLTIYYDSDDVIQGARRPSRGSPFGPPVVIEVGSGVGAELSADQQTLFFASARGDVGDRDLYRARRRPDNSFAPPVLIAELSTAGFECCMTIEASGAVLFTSDRSTPIAIWRAEPTPSDGFGLPSRFAPVSDALPGVVDAFMVRDQRTIMFAGQSGAMSFDLYIIERHCVETK